MGFLISIIPLALVLSMWASCERQYRRNLNMNVHREALVARVADAARAATVARQRLLSVEVQRSLQPLERERLRDLLEDAERSLLAAASYANQETL